jgi:uncharacterized protein (TIGR02284 family)
MHTDSRVESAGRDHVVSTLNSFLRGEISAVETYRQAYERLRTTSYGDTVRDCMLSHEQRVNLLTREIQRLGGAPAEGSGVWGAFAKLVEGSATTFGEKAAIMALEEGEDHGRNDYERDIDKLDADTKQFVQAHCYAAQLRTHDTISALKKSLSSH